MRKLTALFVASTLALGATSMAFAADTATTTAAPTEGKMMMHHKGKPGMHHEMMMFKDLNLTDAQKQQIRDMETQNKIYNILTPEQKKQFNANFEKRLTERAAPEGKMPAPTE